jgi:hypothetical protein
MSAVEEIEQAIAKLTAEWRAAEEGPWMQVGGTVAMGDVSDDPDAWPVIAESMDGEARLIVTLHRTIDAQLGLLQWGLDIYKIPNRQYPSPLETRVLALARAINGVTE